MTVWLPVPLELLSWETWISSGKLSLHTDSRQGKRFRCLGLQMGHFQVLIISLQEGFAGRASKRAGWHSERHVSSQEFSKCASRKSMPQSHSSRLYPSRFHNFELGFFLAKRHYFALSAVPAWHICFTLVIICTFHLQIQNDSSFT